MNKKIILSGDIDKCVAKKQIASKKFRGKKVFLVAPLHHHFEAIGWPSYKVTMRYWVFSLVCAILGISLALIG